MFDYPEQIEQFIATKFEPCSPEEASMILGISELLLFLFEIFPNGCISEYELHETMLRLNYPVHIISEHGNYSLSWCLRKV